MSQLKYAYAGAPARLTEREIKRGDVFFIPSDRSEVGTEIFGSRPVVVMSSAEQIAKFQKATVISLTTKPFNNCSLHEEIRTVDGWGNEKKSYACCESIQTISTARFKDYLCTLTEEEMQRVSRRAMEAMGISPFETPIIEDNSSVQTLESKIQELEAELKAAKEYGALQAGMVASLNESKTQAVVMLKAALRAFD